MVMIVSLIGIVLHAAQRSEDRAKNAGFEALAVELRNSIERHYGQEDDITTVTGARLWNNRLIPTPLRGPSVAFPLRGPQGDAMVLGHVTLTGETRPSILAFSFLLPREPNPARQRDACRRWVTGMLPHFPYIALNTAIVATPRTGDLDVTTAATIEAMVATQCANPAAAPTFSFGMIL